MSKPESETALRRGIISFPDGRHYMDDGATFVSGDQGLTVSVSDEQAVDSYNSQFECDYVLSRKDAEALHRWLGEMLS